MYACMYAFMYVCMYTLCESVFVVWVRFAAQQIVVYAFSASSANGNFNTFYALRNAIPNI